MKNIVRKVRIVIGSIPLMGPLTLLFAVALLLLLTLLLLEIRRAYEVVMPTGQNAEEGTTAIIEKGGQEILILNSYNRGYLWSDHEMDGMIETFGKAGWKIMPLIEYLDCRQFPKMEHFDRLRDLLLQKYRGRNFPVVIAADNPALEFALRYRPDLFPRAAIVFCGINGFNKKMIRGYANITGIVERLDIHGTMSIAMKLHPKTREVVIIHDYTITGLLTRREAEEQLKPFEGLVSFRYVKNMTVSELIEYVKSLPSDTLVLSLAYSMDKNGRMVDYDLFSKILSSVSPVPIYSLHEERIGYGILGGSVLSGKLHGMHAAEIALRVLSGVPAQMIPVQLYCPPRTIFDYNQLRRFHIPLGSLPADSVIVNRPVSFFARYPGLVFTTTGIMVILVAGIMVLGFNVYERRMAEEEQKKLHAQLMQAQKMEAVGLLAGGVAHDFNNIMTAIIGYANLLYQRMTSDPTGMTYLEHILSASERASNVTRSLLAFSRKQVIEAKPVDLNDIVRNTEKIVMPLIGADILFTTFLIDGTLTVMADSGQIEQVLMNLCTNARDAMRHGGRLTIQTEKIMVDDAYRKSHLLEKSGRYGVISVSDTGVGMDEDTRKQIFEPFFTTKEVGKGTGLGLSIAYGIIKQHGGTITVYSEPGNGTVFKIYFPLITAATRPLWPKGSEPVQGGQETILLAEDEAEVRSMMMTALKQAGYTVIEAVDGADAMDKLKEHKEKIRLLLTDVIMPKINGPQVYQQLKKINPALKVLFMSGYTADMIQSEGLDQEKMRFISKPVRPADLLKKVREVLDA